MSEYQYYEFQAIDRPLSEREMRELRALSTRAQITPTSFTNVYHWGNFRGDPHRLMEKYFDAFVYVTNWGTYRFMLRLPRRAIDLEAARLYCPGGSVSIGLKGKNILLDFCCQLEEPEDDWETGEGQLSSLIPLRADLLAGDLRSLYLGWLLCAQAGELNDKAVEPPLPPGLSRLSGALKVFADFLRIDADLIEVAVERTTGEKQPCPSRKELATWINALSQAEKNSLMLRLLADDTPHLRWELLRRFRKARAKVGQPGSESQDVGKRAVGQLLATARARAEERRRRAAEQAARERARRAREEARAREVPRRSCKAGNQSLAPG